MAPHGVDTLRRVPDADPVRFLLINNHCVTDPTAGVAQSLRTIMRWLAEAGHACHILTTARTTAVPFAIDEHLRALGVPLEPVDATDPRLTSVSRQVRRRFKAPVVRYTIDGVPVTLVVTRHHDELRPDSGETSQYVAVFERLLDEFTPDQVIACNAHPMIGEALAMARARGITTVFTIRAEGYYEPRYFEHVDHVFTACEYLTDVHWERIGLVSTAIDSPIDWSAVLAPADEREFVTFVHPAPHKGVALFARLADMLGARRPDIPILIVQSGRSAGWLNTLPGMDWTRYPHIVAAPPVARPADFFALTRILLVPSVVEAFGRVAAEAMINGIPAVVSDRGGLPNTVGGAFEAGGGARVLSIPHWMTSSPEKIPTEDEVRPWYDAVCGLWDDEALYERVATRAREIAAARYSEAVSRGRHVGYLTSLKPGARPFDS
jgi:glycosyltransferase involved in cell wall biosynthesis